MEHEFKDGRLYLHRSPEERAAIVNRLNRIEGQVRGVRQMVEDDRYCLDEVQQITAINAALREVALLIISDHLTASVELAVQTHDGQEAIKEMMTVLRAALRR